MRLSLLAGDTRFAPYEIRAPLGRGGMGEVYRAWDPRLHRDVALKVLHERAGADPDRVRRFIAEARAASALNHPNILTAFDADVDGAIPYIVSELIDGSSLREQIRRGPVPPSNGCSTWRRRSPTGWPRPTPRESCIAI